MDESLFGTGKPVIPARVKKVLLASAMARQLTAGDRQSSPRQAVRDGLEFARSATSAMNQQHTGPAAIGVTRKKRAFFFVRTARDTGPSPISQERNNFANCQ